VSDITHFGRDRWEDYRAQWFGPFGVGVRRREITLRFWLPSLSWVWGYWR